MKPVSGIRYMHPEYQGSNVRDQDLFHHIRLHCNHLHTSQQAPFFSVAYQSFLHSHLQPDILRYDSDDIHR